MSGAAPAPTPVAGLQWSRHDLGPSGPAIRTVVEGGPGFIGISAADAPGGGGSGIWSSSDGVNWSEVDPPRAGRNLVDIVAGGPGYVAISASPAGVWTSADGTAWTQARSVPSSDDAVLTSLASGDGSLVATGQGAIWASRDGLAWEEAELPDNEGTIHDVVAGGPGFVAVGSILVGSMEAKGAVWTSPDGRIWERLPDRPEFERSELRAVAAHGHRIVATGWTTDLDRGLFFVPAAWTSTDGMSWRRATVNDKELPVGGSYTGALEGAVMMVVTRTSDRWVSAGMALTAGTDEAAADTAIWTSIDEGTTWQRAPHDARFEVGMTWSTGFGATAVATAGTGVIVVGRTADGQSSAWISPPAAGWDCAHAAPAAAPRERRVETA